MVAATRSRVCQVFGAIPAHKTGAAPASVKGFGDQSGTTEDSCNPMINYTCLVNKSGSPKSQVKLKPGRRQGSKPNLGSFKHCRNYAPIKSDDLNSAGASRAEADSGELVSQPIRRDFGASEIPKPSTGSSSTNSPSGQPITPPSTLKFGMYAGRVKANPLKYLATVLRAKLQPHFEACNLLEVATEIHDEAKNKHNTTLRRIYDVVNVLEAAGLLERSNGSTSKRPSRTQSTKERASNSNTKTESPSAAECSTSAVEFGADRTECDDDEQVETNCPNPTPLTESNSNPLEKKCATRGSRIRWLGSESELEVRCHRQTLGRLAEEKVTALQRISEKRLEFENLQEELRLTTELIKHNQNGTYQSDCFESTMNPCTPPPEDLSCSYLNFEDCSPTSAETERTPAGSVELHAVIGGAAAHYSSTMFGSSSSSTSREFDPGLFDPSMITEEDLNFWYDRSNILEGAEEYQSNGFPPMNSGTEAKGIHTPFVILQTNNTTNVDIELDGSLTSEVYFALDNEYKMFDYRELLSAMFPADVCDGGFHYVDHTS